MNIKLISQIVQLVISAILTMLILIQGKGTGLSSGFSSSFSFYRSNRGVEKAIFILTILLSLALVVNSFALILLN